MKKLLSREIGWLVLLLVACNISPQPIRVGKDTCTYCKMAIGNNRFGAEIISVKGKIFKYDEIHCLLNDMEAKKISKAAIKAIYFTDFCGTHELVNSKNAFYLKCEKLMSPMGGNIAIFANEDSLLSIKIQLEGKQVYWNDLY